MDELKDKLPKFKIIDNRLYQYGMIIEGRQWNGIETMYDAKINGIIYVFHITQLEPQ
jgi:hypothetical protein